MGASTCIAVILSPSSAGWMVLKALEKSEEHDSRSACRLVQMSVDSVQQVDDATLHSQAGLVGEL